MRQTKAYADYLAQLPNGKLTADDLLAPDMLVTRDGPLSIYFAPFDYVNDRACIALVGITPGLEQLRIAVEAARDAARGGASLNDALRIAKHAASFGGPMRRNLVTMLDGLGVADALGVETTDAVFDPGSDLAHFTSVVKYPVFVEGRNYTGHKPKIMQIEAIRRFALGPFRDELRQLPDPLIVPMGRAVADVLVKLDAPNAVLWNFPHPSGANGHRVRQYDQHRTAMREQVAAWAARR